jgi:hypothetical protein
MQRQSRRLATYDHARKRPRQGWSNRAIAQQLGIGRMPAVRDSPGADLPRAPRAQRHWEEYAHPG